MGNIVSDFCWMCCGDWRSHGSEYYECSRYKSNPNIVNESAGIQAREALKKYLFYFERVCDVKCTYSPVFRFTTMTSLSKTKGLCVPIDMLAYPASSWKRGLAWYRKILWRCWPWDLCFYIYAPNLLMFYSCKTGLKITAGQRTMSGQNGLLTGQKFHSPVMLTGHAHSHSWINNQILTWKSDFDFF